MGRRPFFVWLGDVVCALVAYTLSRWIHQGTTKGVFENLPVELGTFAGLYVLLKLLLKAAGAAMRKGKAAPPPAAKG